MSLSNLNPTKILIRSTNWVGDAVMTTPAVRTIRENFPQAHIAILVHPWVAGIFQASPHVDEIIPYYKKTTHRGLLGMIRLAGELSRQHFDMAILLQNAFEAALITKLAKIPVRAGYQRDGRSLLLTHRVAIPPERKKIHQVFYYQKLLEDLGLQCGSDQLFLQADSSDRRFADDMLGKHKDSKRLIGFNPGAAYGPAKKWPAEKYARLGKLLIEEDNRTVIVIFGTDADKEAAGIIQDGLGENVLNLTGETSLGQAIAVIERCQTFVTNDSGLMHVAAALQTPLVAIFGSTNHVTTGPFADKVKIIRRDVPCSPCYQTHCKEGHYHCMESITSREVLTAVQELQEELRN